MATPTPISVLNVALPNAADSGNISITIPTGANACHVGGLYYVSDSSVITSITGSAFAATTNGALSVNNPSSGAYMGTYSIALKITATGTQNIRVQKTGAYSEGPTCQIRFYTVDDPDNFVPTGGHVVVQQTAVPEVLSATVNSNSTDLVAGFFGTDGSSADPTAPTGTTQQGTMQTTLSDKQIAFAVTTPGASTTTVTSGSRDYPGMSLLALRGSSGPTPTNYTLTCDVGAYTLAGEAAALRRGYSLTANAGAFALTGHDAALRRGYRLVADTGAYSLSGQDAALRRGYVLALETGAYSLTGHDATLIYSAGSANYTLTCETGAYALTGIAAGLLLGRRLVLDAGAYAITGQDATLRYGRRLVCETGAYTLTGSDADLVYTATGPIAYSLTCERGDYLLTGSDAALVYTDGSAPVGSPHGFELVDHPSSMWWKRKPKALPVAVAEQRIKRVVQALDEIATGKIEQDEPIKQRDVRAEIAPLLAEMPGFDWRPLFKAIVEFRQQEAARLEAIAQIERIRALESDDEDVMILLMSF